MSQEVKQEGSFKLQKPKPAARKLNKPATVTKVDLQTKTEDNAIQEQSTNESLLQPKQPEVGLQEVEQGNQVNQIVTEKIVSEEEVIEVNVTPVTVIQEISEEEVAISTRE